VSFPQYKQNLWKLFFMSHRGYRKRTSPMFMRCNIAILTPKIITLYEFAGLFALKTRFSQAGRGKCLRVKFYTHVQKSMFFVKTRFSIRGNFAIAGDLRASKISRYLGACRITYERGARPTWHKWWQTWELCPAVVRVLDVVCQSERFC
jgi:hypothetical protein